MWVALFGPFAPLWPSKRTLFVGYGLLVVGSRLPVVVATDRPSEPCCARLAHCLADRAEVFYLELDMLMLVVGHGAVFLLAGFGGYLWAKFRNNSASAILTLVALAGGGYFLGWWVLASFFAGTYWGQRLAFSEYARQLEEQGLRHPFSEPADKP